MRRAKLEQKGLVEQVWGWFGRERLSERFSMRVTPTTKARVMMFRADTGAKSATQLISWALTLLEMAWETTKEGGEVVFVAPDGAQTRVKMPWESSD